MVRRIRLSAFLPVESTPLGITETGDPGVPADISLASGAGWISGVAAESTVGAGVLARAAGGGTTGLGVRLMEAAICRGSGMVCSPGKTPATVRGLSSFMISVGISINRLGVPTRAANAEDPPAADITRWAQAASTAPASPIRRVRPFFRRLRELLAGVGAERAGSTTRAGSIRTGSIRTGSTTLAGCTARRGSGAGVPSMIGGCEETTALGGGGGARWTGGGGGSCLAGGGETGFGAGHAASAAWVAAEVEGGGEAVCASPSFSDESGATGGPATRSACVSGIDTAIL